MSSSTICLQQTFPPASTPASPPPFCLSPHWRFWSFWTSISRISHCQVFANSFLLPAVTLFIFFAWHIYTHSSTLKSKFPFSSQFSWRSLDKINHCVPNHFILLLLLHNYIMTHLFKCWNCCCLKVKSEYFSFSCLRHLSCILIPYNTADGQLWAEDLQCAGISVFLHGLSWKYN